MTVIANISDALADFFKRIGDWLPRFVPASDARRVIVLSLLVVSSNAVAVGAGIELRDWSLARISAIYGEDTAVISTAYIDEKDLETVYRVARSDPRVQQLLEQTREARYIVYVVPSEGRGPLVLAFVDVDKLEVNEIASPSSHVKWGDISTPMF